MKEPLTKTVSEPAPLVAHLRRPAVLLLILAAVTFIVYSSTLSFEFVWDDHQQIVNNPLVRSWSSVGRAFTSDLWYHFNRGQLYYRPLFLVWSILNYTLFGLNPWGWHLGVVLLHVVASLLVFLLGRKLGLEYWTSALAAFLFALHPVHIECAAWVSAGSDSMVAIFYMLAFLAFLNSRKSAHPVGWTAGALTLLACGLLTKEAALSFCVVIFAYVFLFPSESASGNRIRRFRDALIAVSPYFAVTVLYLLIRVQVLHKMTADLDPNHGFGDILLSLPEVLGLYLRMLVLPFGVTGLYYTPYAGSLGMRNFFLPLLALLACVGLLGWWWRRSRDNRIPFLFLWTGLCLVPVLNLRSFDPGSFVRDRYMYLPSIGAIVLMAMALRSLPSVSALGKRIQLLVILGVCCIIGAANVWQQIQWANDLLLFARGYNLYPESTYNTSALAAVLGDRGQYRRSLELLQDAYRRDPSQMRIIVPLAQAYARNQRIEEGRQLLFTAMGQGLTNGYSEVETSELIGALGSVHDYDRALSLCSGLLSRDPNLYSALYNCGTTNYLAGHYPEAESLLKRAIAQSPELGDPCYYLGRVLLESGRLAEAETALRAAIALRRDVPEYYLWLGFALEKAGRIPEARSQYLTALQLYPDYAEAKSKLDALPR